MPNIGSKWKPCLNFPLILNVKHENFSDFFPVEKLKKMEDAEKKTPTVIPPFLINEMKDKVLLRMCSMKFLR